MPCKILPEISKSSNFFKKPNSVGSSAISLCETSSSERFSSLHNSGQIFVNLLLFINKLSNAVKPVISAGISDIALVPKHNNLSAGRFSISAGTTVKLLPAKNRSSR